MNLQAQKKYSIVIQFLGLVLLGSSFALAQSATATLSGIVQDTNGAAIARAAVVIENTATTQRRETTTNGEGVFTLIALPPGNYHLTVQAVGFAPLKSTGLVLNVNDQRALRLQLKIGDVSEAVEITTPAGLQETAAVGTVVNQQFVENLPLNGRSIHSLIALTPGVVQTPASQRSPGQFSVNGQRTSSNYFTVDGVSAAFALSTGTNISSRNEDGVTPAFGATGGTNSLVAVDALQEFRIQTSTFAPEFGRTPGGQIQMLTRSGARQWHATLFEYFRNEKLDANDWFANRDRFQRVPLRQNDFGGTLSGPLTLPKKVFGPLGSNREPTTFFFFSYEGLRLRQPLFSIEAYPSLASRARAVPSIQPIIKAYPIPNREDLGNGFARFAAAYSNPSNLDATSLRLDHAFNARVSLFGRYSDAPSSYQTRGDLLTFPLTLNTLAKVKTRPRMLTIGSTQTLTSALTNEARFNVSHYGTDFDATLDGLGGAIPPPDALFYAGGSDRTRGYAAAISLDSDGVLIGNLGGSEQRQLNFVDNLSAVAGHHQLKFGVDYRQLNPHLTNPAYQNFGVFGNLNGFLAGTTFVTVVTAFDGIELRTRNLSLFAQDTWRVTPRVTLTYGLRWDYNPPAVGVDKPLFTAVGIENVATATLSAPGAPLFEAPKDLFAPRLGLAWQLRSAAGRELTLRGGVGMFYDLPQGFIFAASNSPPYRRTKRVPGAAYPSSPTVAAPLPPNTPGPYDSISAFAPGIAMPRTYQFNLALEQSLGAGRTLSATYVGALGRQLWRTEFATSPTFRTFVLPYVTRSNASSDYHALQLQFQQRLARGLQLMFSHNWSHSIDTASSNVGFNTLPSPAEPRLDRGASDFDVRHNFTTALTYDLPRRGIGNRAVRGLLNGWGADAILRLQSALPVTVFSRIATTLGQYDLRPNLVAGQPLYLEGAQYPGGRAFNRAAFQTPAGQTAQGTLGRNTLRGFPLRQFDLSLRRDFALRERARLQFRADLFNVLNVPNFAPPSGFLTNPLFGVSTAVYSKGLGAGGVDGGQNPLFSAGGPRSIQLGLKLLF